MDWKNVEVVMACSSRDWNTIVKRMRKTILESWSSHRNSKWMPFRHKWDVSNTWAILVATACQTQGCGVKLAWTMARDHIRDSRTHHASHREHLLPLYDHVDCDRHASGHDGRTSVSCWTFFHSHPNNMQMHVESLVFGSFQPEHMCKPVSSK
jgi:hypothetical protein